MQVEKNQAFDRHRKARADGEDQAGELGLVTWEWLCTVPKHQARLNSTTAPYYIRILLYQHNYSSVRHGHTTRFQDLEFRNTVRWGLEPSFN